MNRAEKTAAIAELKEKFENSSFFYVADSSSLTVEDINELRGSCFEQDIEVRVVKNTLAKKALEAAPEEKGYADLAEAFKGPSTLFFTDTANTPARVIKEFRKSHDKPVLKAAYIDSSIYIGDDQLDALASLKSKDELIGEIVGLLQSPMKNLLGSLQSGGSTIMGLLKTLEEREG